ncbi:MAG: hypothetical protein DMF80_17115 [Acidobacteria bacterium]|nr:MAG: hypothetical protein DMF80_17115 [Acidobacteriota bacterium]
MGLAAPWVGPYRILEKLGAGAMGEVYLAEDPRLHRRVALKTLADPVNTAPEARRRLLHEARAAARLNHPNVAAIYDVVESPDSVHLVMEYVPGETLAARLRGGRLDSAAVVAIGVQLADALAEAHAMGVIHRDLKPGNVIVTPGERVKVLDFGVARTHGVRLVDPDSGYSSSSRDKSSDVRTMVGTPPYVPPECFLGQPADARGDIYSLGVTLFEMLTGRRPFAGKDVQAVGVAALTEATPRARGANDGVSFGLDAIVARAMAREPRDRYGSAAELAAALRDEQEALRDASTLSGPGWRLPDLRRWTRPRSAWALITVLLAVYSYSILLKARRPPSSAGPPGSAVVAVLPLANATGDPGNDHLGAGIADVLIATLARVPGVTMISRSATLPYRERRKDVASIARELGADLVVDGAVQASGKAVRVTLSLLRPQSNLVAWSGAYDGAFSDLFTLQNEAATALSQALQVTLSPEQRRRIGRPPTANVEALADYVQARSFLQRPDVKGDNLEHSIGLFQSALARDPRFAGAHAGLGQAYWLRFEEMREAQWSEKAFVAITESLRLDPEDAAAHQALAIVYQGKGRTDQAEEEFRRAISLLPTSDEAHSLLGRMLCEQGRREEGIAELKKAIALRPNYWGHHYELAIAYFDSGRYPEAAATCRRVIELQPDSSRGLLLLGTVYYASGDNRRAIATLRQANALSPDAATYTNLGAALLADRRYAEAAQAFEEAARRAPKAPSKQRNLGEVYERLGRGEAARQAYRRAVELSQEQLRTNPRDARTLSMLAVDEAKLGQWPEARRHADEATALSPHMADVIYRKAVVLALASRPDDSLAALEQAIAEGFGRARAAGDEDLKTLRGLREFQRLIGDAPVPAKGGSK